MFAGLSYFCRKLRSLARLQVKTWLQNSSYYLEKLQSQASHCILLLTDNISNKDDPILW